MDQTRKDLDTYSILVEHKVQHIATFGKGNDVGDNVTLTDTIRTGIWACLTTKMVALHNYRMSLKEVGRRLSDFKSSEEFVGSVAEAMEGKEAQTLVTFCYSFVFLQRMMVLSLMLTSFIVISV